LGYYGFNPHYWKKGRLGWNGFLRILPKKAGKEELNFIWKEIWGRFGIIFLRLLGLFLGWIGFWAKLWAGDFFNVGNFKGQEGTP